jgi:hypothetical protein
VVATPTSGFTSIPQTIVDVDMETTPRPVSEAFIDITVALNVLAQPLMPAKLLRFILNANDKPSLAPHRNLYPHLAKSCVEPQLVLWT